MKIEKTIFLLTALFFILLQGAFVLLGDNAVLSDDLNHLEILYQYQEGKYSISKVYNLYISDPNRHTRPISPIVITFATYLGRNQKKINERKISFIKKIQGRF